MKSIKIKALAAILSATVALCACLPFTACIRKLPYRRIGKADDFLTAVGDKVKNGYGEEVYLRGVNAGGLFVTEHWMTGFDYGTSPNDDFKSLTKTFIERFDKKKEEASRTKALWEEYRANWWTDVDFENCAEMGMTVIRLPFTYMNVDFAAVTGYENAGKEYDFSDLDAFVKRAADYGMYTILDLHGAYGSQSGQDHTGEILDYRDVDFYSNEQMQTLTVNLWKALSEHYKDNAAVAGYDILNEPGERRGNGNDGVMSTEKRHWDFFDKVYDAIRANGDNHIVIFESCWDGKNLPKPSEYGWENCMYSFHHYAGTALSEKDYQANWENKLKEITSQNFGIPLQMGEFTNYSSEANWEYALNLMNGSGWHWTSWTYKVWGRMAWGIYNIVAGEDKKVNADVDGYDVILNKFGVLRTDGENAQKYAFRAKNEGEEPRTLEEIITKYCKPAEGEAEQEK